MRILGGGLWRTMAYYSVIVESKCRVLLARLLRMCNSPWGLEMRAVDSSTAMACYCLVVRTEC